MPNLLISTKNHMVNIRPLFIIVVLFAYSPVFSQSKSVSGIVALIREEEKAWNKGDIEGYVKLYAPEDSTRMIFSSGAVYGRDSILAFYKRYWPREKMGNLTLTHDSIEKITGSIYFVSGFFLVDYPSGKAVKGRFSGLVKKIKGKWYIYTDHSG